MLQGFFVVVLDPLEKIPDMDRLDNVFIQYAQFSDSVEFSPVCDVVALGPSSGKQTAALHTLILSCVSLQTGELSSPSMISRSTEL